MLVHAKTCSGRPWLHKIMHAYTRVMCAIEMADRIYMIRFILDTDRLVIYHHRAYLVEQGESYNTYIVIHKASLYYARHNFGGCGCHNG